MTRWGSFLKASLLATNWAHLPADYADVQSGARGEVRDHRHIGAAGEACDDPGEHRHGRLGADVEYGIWAASTI